MDVTVDIIFSNNHKIGSKLIVWGTKHLCPTIKEIPSHGALLINNRWVIESTLETGVRVILYTNWLKLNNEIIKIPCKSQWKYKDIKYMYKELQNKKYDYPGVIFQALCIIPNKLFHTPIPKNNILQSDNKYFCLEVIGKLTNKDYKMTTPIQLMFELIKEI